MKYALLTLVALVSSMSSLASTFTSKIHSIDFGKKHEPTIVLLENGRTAFVEKASKHLGESLNQLRKENETIEVTLDQKLNLVSLTIVSPQEGPERGPELEAPAAKAFEPTLVTLARGKTIFNNMRRDYQNKSQCYNRAHIWAAEEFYRTATKTAKLFLFFTSRYIRNYRYKWWFHVTPMTFVGGFAQSNWRTMDRRYTMGLLTTKAWTNEFMLNNALCPVVTKYSAYRNNQNSQDCYLIPTTMYYWQPRDIERIEQSGYEKKNFIRSEVNHAYWEAF